jgi:hypothetical protein
MILVYSLLEENRDRLITQLVSQVRAEDRVYHRLSRLELRESISTLYDAYVDFLASKNKARLSISLTYIVRSRISQSFSLSAILKGALCFFPVFRNFFDDSKALDYLEKPLFEMIDLLIQIFEEQQQPRPKKNLDLSKLTVYRA